jgi:hypothetical protein
MGTVKNNMFIPKGVDENDPSLHHEIVKLDVAWQDIREGPCVYVRYLGRIPDRWNLVLCITQEQLEVLKLEGERLEKKYGYQPGNWVLSDSTLSDLKIRRTRGSADG